VPATFRPHIEPEIDADYIQGALDGILAQWLLDPNSVDFAKAIARLKVDLMRAICVSNVEN